MIPLAWLKQNVLQPTTEEYSEGIWRGSWIARSSEKGRRLCSLPLLICQDHHRLGALMLGRWAP